MEAYIVTGYIGSDVVFEHCTTRLGALRVAVDLCGIEAGERQEHELHSLLSDCELPLAIYQVHADGYSDLVAETNHWRVRP